MADLNLNQKFEQLPEETTEIRVSNVTNPSKMYISFRWLSDVIEIMYIESEMEDAFNMEDPAEGYFPEKNEIVAFYHIPMEKFIRVVVEEVGEVEDSFFNVWAIDYGFDSITHGTSSFRKLPERFKNFPSQIAEMCLDVQPIKKVNGIMTLANYEEWNQMAVIRFKSVLNEALELKIVEQKVIKGIIFGDILVRSEDGAITSLKQRLIADNHAVELDYSSYFVKELFESSPLNRRRLSFKYEEDSTDDISNEVANKIEAADAPDYPTSDQNSSDAECGSSESSMPPENLPPPSRLYLKEKTVDGKKAFVTEYGPMVEETSEFLASMTTEERFDYDYPLLSRLIKSEELKRQQGQEDNANEPLPSTSKGIPEDPNTGKKTE